MEFTKADLLDYMRGHQLAVVSSIGPRGEPQAALVGIAVSPHEVIFHTVAHSRKHANLLRDPRASLVLTGQRRRRCNLKGPPDPFRSPEPRMLNYDPFTMKPGLTAAVV